MEIGEAVQQREAHGTAIEALDVLVGVAVCKSLERMNTGAVVREQAVSDTNDGDACRVTGH